MEIFFLLMIVGAFFFNWMFGDHNNRQENQSTTRQTGTSPNPIVPFLIYDMYLDHLEGDHYRDNELYAGDVLMMNDFEGDDDRQNEEPDQYENYDEDYGEDYENEWDGF